MSQEHEALKEKPKGKTKYLVIDDEGYGYLPYTDENGTISHRLMGAAFAALHKGYRGSIYQGPNKQEAISKLKGIYQAEGLETPDEKSLSELALGEKPEVATLSDVKDGLVRIAIAQTGNYEKDGRPFTISDQDLKDMERNLKDREVPLDYEHLSANPDAPPGHSRASGWIKAPDKIEPFQGNSKILWGWAEFTPACLMAIKDKEFRFFSPEIHWAEKDQHGKSIGTRLAAGAITNRPFLKDLPPIEIEAKDFPELLQAVALSEFGRQRLIDVGDVHVPADINKSHKEGNAMKKLSMKKLTKGEGKGKHGIFDGDEAIGMVDADELAELAEEMHADELDELGEYKQCGDLKSLKKKLEELEELKKSGSGKKLSETEMAELEELRASSKKNMEELEELRKLKARTQKGGDLAVDGDGDDDGDDQKSMKKLTDVVKAHNAAKVNAQDVQCLSEFAKAEPGEKTELLADDMLTRGKLSLSGFRKHQRIERMIDGAIAKGKLLPKQRQAMYELAIANFDSVSKLLSEAKAVVDLKEHGIAGDNQEKSAVEELDALTTAYLSEHKDKTYADALKAVTTQHPDLWRRHRESLVARKEAR
jgi:Mu-like prophage I protein